MRVAEVYHNGRAAGLLTEHERRDYEFRYHESWLRNERCPALSLTLPKSQAAFRADHLFPVFFNLLSEGANYQLQARHLRIDERDYFGMLLATAQVDTVGAITVQPVAP